VLVKGKASVTITASGVGVHQITYAYGGDSNYAVTTSGVLSQTVLVTAAKIPLILSTIGATTLPAEFLPGDKGTVAVALTNGGGATGHGKVNVNLYLSPDGVIDSSAIALNVPSLLNHAISVGSGKSITLTGHFTAGRYTPDDYFLVAQVTPVTIFT